MGVQVPVFESAHEGVDLEGEPPSLGILVVQFKEIDIFIASDILPLGQGLVEGG